mgnify:CR=1 FL=1
MARKAKKITEEREAENGCFCPSCGSKLIAGGSPEPKKPEVMALPEAARFLLDKVLYPFTDSSLYEDYQRPEASNFSGVQFNEALIALERVAKPR